MDVADEVAGAARALLRLEGDGEAALMARLAQAATAAAERFCGTDFAGVGWQAIPAPVAHGMVVLAAHLFENRGRDEEPPAAVAALWRPYRRMGIGA